MKISLYACHATTFQLYWRGLGHDNDMICPFEDIAQEPIVWSRLGETLPKEKTVEEGIINNDYDALNLSTTGLSQEDATKSAFAAASDAEPWRFRNLAH